jgi:CheY-like chemotaxis protein
MGTVLVVDDDLVFANSIAELIRRRTTLTVVSTNDPDEAIEVATRESISVAVLDQKMPIKSGTELFSAIKLVDPKLRAIMLTGEASADEVGAALALGYSQYLPKGKIEDLPNLVLREYAAHQADVAIDVATRELTVLSRGRKRYLLWGSRNICKLADLVDLGESHIDDDLWEPILQLNAGEQREHTATWAASSALTLERQIASSLKQTVDLKGVPIPQIAASLEASLAETIRSESTRNQSLSETKGQIFKLPEQPATPDVDYVRSRNFERAPVYRRFLATLAITCDQCSTTSLAPVTLRYFTGRFATRHRDYRSDGTESIVPTGFARE